jgi:beta-lactamase regulating signal transducer with metallopeptidase domain/predicted  nucleic acid-binding Zn-ribbon protein
MTALLLLKLTLLLLASLGVARLLRRAPASSRHRFWSGVFPALLALPFLALVLPAVHVPIPAAWIVSNTADDTAEGRPASREAPRAAAIDRQPLSSDAAAAVADGRTSLQQSLPATAERPDLRTVLLAAWAIGTGIALAMLVLSLARVRILSLDAEVLCDPAWRTAADDIGSRLGLRRPVRLLVSSAVTTPMAGGVFRPSIFLPDASPAWSAERRDIVLAHEIAHLVRHDPLRHVLARLTLACYWFHPLAWIAGRHASIAREEACDEAVLSLGTRPSTYARVLLDFADAVTPRSAAIGALPMVQPSMLEKRLTAILNGDGRPASRHAALLPVLGVTALTLAAAVAQPAAVAAPTVVQQAAQSPQEIVPEPSSSPSEVAPSWAPGPQTEIRFEGQISLARAQGSGTPGAACSSEQSGNQSFTGSTTISMDGVREMVGWRGADRVIQKVFDELRVCMLAEDVGERDSTDHPSHWIDYAGRIVLATDRRGSVQRLEIVRERGGSQRSTWLVNGKIRPVDRAFEEWRRQTLAVLDTTWEVSALRGQVSSLRGEISSIRGERSSLLGEISSLRGEVSSMRGEISSVRGQESSLRGEISSINGHLSSLRGAISSENGAISSLHASRYGSDSADRTRIAARVAEHDKEIERLEREIRVYDADARVAAVEKEIAAFNADSKVAAIDARIKAFDLDARIAEVERRITALDVDRRIATIEREIDALDADRRVSQLEARRRDELKRLEAAIAPVR